MFAISSPAVLPADKLDFIVGVLEDVRPKLEAGDFEGAMDVLRAVGVPEEAIERGRMMLKDASDKDRRQIDRPGAAVRSDGLG